MQLLSEKVEIRGEEFEVRELTVGVMTPLLENLEEEGGVGQRGIIMASVYQNGEPIGERLNEMPSVVYRKLIPVVMRLNALGPEDDTEGKD